MKKIYYLTLIIFLFNACEFDDINVNPSTSSTIGMNEVLPVTIAQTVRNIASIGGRVTGTVMQHWTGVEAQPLGYTNYLIDEQTLTTFWESGLYAGAMKDCAIIIELAQEKNQPYYEAIAKVLMAYNLGIATTYWGDVPYSEALKGTESLNSAYDTQEQVYESIQRLLSDAINLLGETGVVDGPGADDLIFSGNTDLWTKTAYALKARYMMHLTKRDANAASQALVWIDSAFTNVAQEPSFTFGTIDNESNPIALFGIERPNQMDVGDTLVSLMSNKNDPRRYKYWFEENGSYLFYSRSSNDLLRAQRNSPLSLITYTELLFLKAEALLRTDQGPMAAQTYALAIVNDMEQLGISASEYNPYLAANIGFAGLVSFEERLAFLISQKYVAMYGQNPNEVWVDYRRTGYPQLDVPADATSSFNPSLVVPRRYLYPITERTTNIDNYQAAIDRQGGHFMDVDMWAFKDE